MFYLGNVYNLTILLISFSELDLEYENISYIYIYMKTLFVPNNFPFG